MKALITAAALVTIASSAFAQNPTTREGWLAAFREAEGVAKCRAVTPITIGMTATALEKSCWGKPDNESTLKTAAGVERTMFYGWKGATRVVLVRGGVVVSIRETR